MALIKCTECGTEISDKASACVKCGAKPKKPTSRWTIFLVGLVSIAMIKCASDEVTKVDSVASSPPQKSAAELRADAELNAAIAAGRLLKKSAKDPSSFKMERFVLFPGGAACYEYRAKNSFGAIVPAQAVFNPPGMVLTSEHERAKFVKAWNSICTKPGGRENAGGLNLLGVW